MDDAKKNEVAGEPGNGSEPVTAPAPAAERVLTVLVHLSDDELLRIDGACRPEVQAQVELARRRVANREAHRDLSPGQVAFLTAVVEGATKDGKLDLRHDKTYLCRGCGAEARYPTARRSGYRGGGYTYVKKGEPDRTKDRIPVSGWSGHGSPTVCGECYQKVKPLVAAALADVAVELPAWFLGADEKPRWTRYRMKRCRCGWEGHEGELGQLRTLMNDGWYHGECPACGARRRPLGDSPFQNLQGYRVIPTGTENKKRSL